MHPASTTTTEADISHALHAQHAWDLIEMVASGDIIESRDGSTAAAAFSLLREIAGVVISATGVAATDEQRDELAKVTMQRVRDLQGAVAASSSVPSWFMTAPVLSCDEAQKLEALQFASELTRALTEELRKTGTEGTKHSKGIRERDAALAAKNASDPWRLWRLRDRSARFLKLLSDALWVDEVEPLLARSARRRPAIVRAVVADRLLPAMTRQAMLPDLDDGLVRDGRGHVLGRIALTTEATIEVVRRGAHALGTVPANRLIRALIHRSHDAWNRGETLPNRVAFQGGWAGLLKAIGCDSRNNYETLKAIAQAGQCIVWETPHAKGEGLWLWSERRGTKKAPGEVAFTLGDALTPGYADVLTRSGDSLPARIARRLVPELRYEPPMGGARERDQGPIWTLQRLMLLELVDQAEQLAADGRVIITQPRWVELARAAGVSTTIIARTLDAWIAGESETAPQLIKRIDTDAWTLANPHAPERDFIAAGGLERTAGRRRAGRKRKPGVPKPRTA